VQHEYPITTLSVSTCMMIDYLTHYAKGITRFTVAANGKLHWNSVTRLNWPVTLDIGVSSKVVEE
jgi:hypothetical protein